MSLTEDAAAEQYQLACDELMEIAEDYNVSEEASDIALAAAQKLTLDYIDNAVENIHARNRQYGAFIDIMENTINNLGKTTLERLLLDPLKRRVRTAKKNSIYHL
ncbi:MAG: hypothetical protein GQ569_12260 [Methylococcaceae bacterium]|nr:hypothetical protein [Methylococcaceae bacterium]